MKAYKLFSMRNGNLYPLYVDATEAIPVGEWIEAKAGEQTLSGKVKSKLGPLAYRPGWHAGDFPFAIHIGGKSKKGLKKPDYRKADQVWAEVEVADSVDWQSEADKNGINKKGKLVPKFAMVAEIPYGGYYHYKTNSNMIGKWIISGNMKVVRVLSDDEVYKINQANGLGVHDLPRLK